ncbi:MAG: PUTATIVE ZINC PROTEASE PROTEIN [Burkholderiaceae bacterium]|nr:MAG: PUTATIVE ZINC PROTEASE PROTEIN [Burkholderiaceae bacterium]
MNDARLPADAAQPHRPRAPRTARAMRAARLAALLALLLGLGGCANLGYYWQSVSGHLQLMRSARPVSEWLADPATPPALKRRLELAQRIRRYAVTALDEPDNASYHRYADLHRSAAVWNVVAAPEFSLTLKTWCFVVVGCVSYRGYYDEAAAEREAAGLAADGLEVSVYGVPAYSTLGWMNWAGGDPLLNTFIDYPDGELARIIFHELAHQVLYVPGDTVFNESYATTVERLGAAQWLVDEGTPAEREQYARVEARRSAFRALTMATRAELAQIYASFGPEAVDRSAELAMKKEAMKNFRQRYAELKSSWGGYAGYDRWVAGANNAAFGALAAYDTLVPDFEALFAHEGRSWPRFFAAVKKLAKLPKDERNKALEAYRG